MKFIKRPFSSRLKEKLSEKIPHVQQRVRSLVRDHSAKEVATVNIGQIVGGMKELPCMFYHASALDPMDGITFRGHSIPEMQQALPKINREPLPEAVFWLLLTGEVPSKADLADLQSELTSNDVLPESTERLIKEFAPSHHPMTVLSMAVLDLQRHSVFADSYNKGELGKNQFWEATFDDGMMLLKLLPRVAGLIYTTKFGKAPTNPTSTDWAGRYSELMGFNNEAMAEVLRGYLAIHCDHEGGNISAHAAYLLNSALSDTFLSFSGALNGLAGPLHGLANQNVLKFLLELQTSLHQNRVEISSPTDKRLLESVTAFVENWLKSKVVPGYGHGKLRNTDPRFTHLKDLSNEYLAGKELVTLVHACESVVPGILKGLGKVKNPFPNVDAHSGVLLYELGMKEFDYYTVVFGVSRALGCVSNMVWARALGLPLERPGSLTLEQLEKLAR